ncbi:site-specific integrase [Mycolicibacterium iranicum]|uniref:Site-specific integrase n=1 Tax=Mycolicibacterium iranicum TaxID=912594 RepID=A0ABT4HLN3_MYCIR|nr:site-specific integrase [Mycolicibacterium iranicum]MCZ0730577.1 site-specific integrase [Mycolicibacterium iranicum]
MSGLADIKSSARASSLNSVADYVGLTVEQRYAVISEKFPDWLLAEPIVFPEHDRTYGWACRVAGCDAAPTDMQQQAMCWRHSRDYRQVKDSIGLDEFLSQAKGRRSRRGRGLTRRSDCRICGGNREARKSGYCRNHFKSYDRMRRRCGFNEGEWRQSQQPFAPVPACAIAPCVHDGEHYPIEIFDSRPICQVHYEQWLKWLEASGHDRGEPAWAVWSAIAADDNYVKPASSRGEVRLARLPDCLQREIRYAIYRHAKTAERTHWRPVDIQKVVDALAEAGIRSLSEPEVAVLEAGSKRATGERRVWLRLPAAARSLSVTSANAKAEGWFDPVIVGAAPFPHTSASRRKVWDLAAVSQGWLRDLLWEHLAYEALRQVGRRPGATTVSARIRSVTLLSRVLWQNRTDHADQPGLLGEADAKAVADTFDVWHRDDITIGTCRGGNTTLTAASRHRYTSGIRTVLEQSRKRNLIGAELDSFILALPEYPDHKRAPRPRPLSYGDFQLLVSDDALQALDAADRDDIGLTDIWLTHAFQGGRISETLKLKLGCVGLIGAAQPYIWRDISKNGLIDYGMPCYLPVYQRLLRRQSATLERLRIRYADQLATLDDAARDRLEHEWHRTMPLFPRPTQNPDLSVEASKDWFYNAWTAWFQELGLTGITTHQTRATLATSLLNNGAPAALVRQLLGHVSEQALAHYAKYNDSNMIRHLQQVWTAGPGMDKPGTILLRPNDITSSDRAAAQARIDLTVVPVEHGLCRYGPVVGGHGCPFEKNCTTGPNGACEHFVLTGADLAYWERKRDAAFHFAEGAPTEEARDYILGQWKPWEPALTGLRDALAELGLLEEAEKLDLRTPIQDYFSPLFSTGWKPAHLDSIEEPSEMT